MKGLRHTFTSSIAQLWPCRDRCKSPHMTQLQSNSAWIGVENHHVTGNLVTLFWDASRTRGRPKRKCRP